MAHVGFFSNPVQSKKQVTVIQDGYPIRPKAMHMMNLPSIMETVLNLFKSFMNDKMKSRMQIGDFSTLQADAGIDVLPEELGGTNGKLQDHMGNSIVSMMHTVRNLHFLSKNSTLISRENCRFFG